MTLTRIAAAFTTIVVIGIGVIAPAASGQTRDERAVRAASDQWQRYIATQNAEGIADLHAPDAVVLMANSPVATGTKAIGGMWAEVVKLPGLAMHWTPTKIEVVSPTVAHEYGTYTDSYNGPDGKKIADAGSYVVIWRKIKGQWRVAYDAPVSSMPAPDQPCKEKGAQ